MTREAKAWYEPLTPLSFLERIAWAMPDRTAVLDEDNRWTWKEFFDRVNRLSNALKGLGVGKGDNVAFLSRNFPPLLEAHYGIPLTGGAIVAINYRLGAAEIMAFCRERLAHFKCPKEIDFGEIPRTSAGKVQKYILRRQEMDRAEGRWTRSSPEPS